MKNFIIEQINKSIEAKKIMLSDENIINSIITFAEVSIKAYSNSKKLLFAGNGGSAADAQHLAGELVSRFYFDRSGLSAIALTTDTSILTAIGNDYGFDKIFSRQIESNGEKGDILIAISTSGNSPNILNALKTCREKGIITLGLTGGIGGAMKEFCDHVIIVPSNETPVIQESHIMIGHMICGLIEEEIFGKNK